MPATKTIPRLPEVTPEKVLKQWYQAKLVERLMQVGAMAKDRALLRRGSRKMQDGTLGQSSDNAAEDDAMNIHIGDVVVSQDAPSPSPSPLAPADGAGSLLKTALISAALIAGPGVGVAIPWALGAFDHPEPPAVMTDKDTRYELVIESGE